MNVLQGSEFALKLSSFMNSQIEGKDFNNCNSRFFLVEVFFFDMAIPAARIQNSGTLNNNSAGSNCGVKKFLEEVFRSFSYTDTDSS